MILKKYEGFFEEIEDSATVSFDSQVEYKGFQTNLDNLKSDIREMERVVLSYQRINKELGKQIDKLLKK